MEATKATKVKESFMIDADKRGSLDLKKARNQFFWTNRENSFDVALHSTDSYVAFYGEKKFREAIIIRKYSEYKPVPGITLRHND